MILKAKISNADIKWENPAIVLAELSKMGDVEVVVEIKKAKHLRTLRQNSAIHLYLSQLAESLNSAGFDVKKTIRQEVEIPWSADNCKELLWRPVQQAMLGKKSTTELEKKDVDKIYDIINKTIGERTGVHCPFPNIETIYEERF